jgi:hypothetical protein
LAGRFWCVGKALSAGAVKSAAKFTETGLITACGSLELPSFASILINILAMFSSRSFFAADFLLLSRLLLCRNGRGRKTRD